VKRWWPGVVWDRPSARRPSIEMQPYNSRDRKRRVCDAAFSLVWWDPKAKKEEWRMVRKPHLQPYIMDVPMGQVVLVDMQWRDGRKLPWEALTLLGYGGEAESAQVERGVSVAAEQQSGGKRNKLDGAGGGAPGAKKARGK